MPHSYPLHESVLAECLCCHSRQRFEFTSRSDQVVCPICTRHLGEEKAAQRDLAHIALWSELLRVSEQSATAQRAAAAVAASASGETIAALTARTSHLVDLAASSYDTDDDARKLIETEILARTERRSRLEARSADVVFAALWGIAQLHDDTGTACICGAVLCRERALLGPVRRRLLDWESRNLALLAAGERHALPAGHPQRR